MIWKQILFSVLWAVTAPGTAFSQGAKPDASYKLITGKSFVQSKNYYLLTLLEQNKAVKTILESDTLLSTLAAKRKANLTVAMKQCQNEAFCLIDNLKISDAEIKQVTTRLGMLYDEHSGVRDLVAKELVPSGTYVLNQTLPFRNLFLKAWEQDAQGINFTIGVYGKGEKPAYPAIDSISFNIKENSYGGFVYSVAYLLYNENKENRLFFSLPLSAALQFLEINDRENAADYEPMISTVNKAAHEAVARIKWDRFKYSVILVPGMGPEKADEALSAEAKLRCRLGALQYQKGVAPFIMVSGGRVHPFKTPYCEAMEMKKFLLEHLKVPERAILVEPFARHTTTNMRNCARLLFRYGIPFSKPGLTCTTRGQSMMIGTVLPERCLKELHAVPFRNGARLSETESEFYPLIEALHINPREPMDS